MLARPKRLKKGKSHNRAHQQETERAASLGGRTTKASGATPYEKGDVRIEGVACIEMKTTSRKSFSVTRAMVDKIECAGNSRNEIPIIEVEFNNEGKAGKSVAVIPSWALDIIMEKLSDVAE